ncbi:MAG: lysoplasmalogenase family protein [Rhodoglobus sp.]
MFAARWFVPYLAISVVHVASLTIGADAAAHVTKFLLMPSLIVAVVVALRFRLRGAGFALVAALAFAWIGDIFVSDTGSSSFLIGLAAFLLTHVAYLFIFIHNVRTRDIPWATSLLLVWWVGLLLLLHDYLDAFLLPLAAYGIVLGASTAAAFATNAAVAVGAVLFLVSDTALASALFVPISAWWNSDTTIMVLYLAGQFLIVVGILRARAGSHEPVSVSG